MDFYTIKHILSFLKECENCKEYDIHNYNLKMCCICKKFYCENCLKKYLIRNYNHYETTSMYCLDCNDYYFNQRMTF